MISPAILAARPAGGPAPYHAGAVHFDGNTAIDVAAISASDSATCSFNFWFKAPVGNNTLYVFDPNNFIFYSQTQLSASPPDVSTVGETTDGSATVGQASNDISAPAWHNIRGWVDGSNGTSLTLTDNVVDTNTPTSNGTPFIIPFSGVEFVMPYTPPGTLILDAADVWIGAGQKYAFNTSGDAFVSAAGKPMPPSGFPSGTILFSGDASSFSVNQGTGGATTMTGTLTNASTSPSD